MNGYNTQYRFRVINLIVMTFFGPNNGIIFAMEKIVWRLMIRLSTASLESQYSSALYHLTYGSYVSDTD